MPGSRGSVHLNLVFLIQLAHLDHLVQFVLVGYLALQCHLVDVVSWLVLLFLPSLTCSPGSILYTGSVANFVRLVYSRYIVLLVNLAFLLKVVDLVTWLAWLTWFPRIWWFSLFTRFAGLTWLTWFFWVTCFSFFSCFSWLWLTWFIWLTGKLVLLLTCMLCDSPGVVCGALHSFGLWALSLL